MTDAANAALVSVVIPTYNHARFLGEAIRSALHQTHPAVEVIVVDDGSTDDTAAVVAGFPGVRYIRQKNLGLAAARNAGFAACRGDLVVFLDADDRLLPNAIETGARVLAANPALGFSAGYSRFVTGDGIELPTGQPVRAGGDAYEELLRRNSIRNPAMVLFRRGIVEAVGSFAPGADACADYDLYLRISREYPVAFHDTVVADYRKHGANMSADPTLMLQQLLVVMRRQRPHLTTPGRSRAFRQGVRHIRTYYGDQIATEIRARLRSRGEWRRIVQCVAVLTWWHPAGALEHVWRKIATWWRAPGATTPGGMVPP